MVHFPSASHPFPVWCDTSSTKTNTTHGSHFRMNSAPCYVGTGWLGTRSMCGIDGAVDATPSELVHPSIGSYQGRRCAPTLRYETKALRANHTAGCRAEGCGSPITEAFDESPVRATAAPNTARPGPTSLEGIVSRPDSPRRQKPTAFRRRSHWSELRNPGSSFSAVLCSFASLGQKGR